MFGKLKSLPAYMDFDGQQRAERIFQVIILLFAAVGLAWGYTCQQFSQTVYILGAGFVLSCMLALPPWPMYRRKPLNWQKAIPEEGTDASPPTQKSSKKKK